MAFRSPGPVARRAAARLAELFERDERLVVDLDDVQKRLRVADRELLEAGPLALLDTRLSSGATACGRWQDGWRLGGGGVSDPQADAYELSSDPLAYDCPTCGAHAGLTCRDITKPPKTRRRPPAAGQVHAHGSQVGVAAVPEVQGVARAILAAAQRSPPLSPGYTVEPDAYPSAT